MDKLILTCSHDIRKGLETVPGFSRERRVEAVCSSVHVELLDKRIECRIFWLFLRNRVKTGAILGFMKSLE